MHYETLDGRKLRTKTMGSGNDKMYISDTMAPKKNSVLVALSFRYVEGRGLTVDSVFANFDFETGKIDAKSARKKNYIGFREE